MSADRLPETLRQAESFGRVVRYSTDAGLCHACAAQLGWAVQNGYTNVRPPCDDCRRVVAGWPVRKPNEWQVPPGTLSASDSWLGYSSDPAAAALSDDSGPVLVAGEV